MANGPIFIVGLHRTGSTLLKNMLNNNPEICMLPDELHLWTIYPWEIDIHTFWYKGTIKNKKHIDDCLNFLFSKQMSGAFWKKYLVEEGITKEEILEALYNKKGLTCIDIATQIFIIYKNKICKKKLWGAKYPVHIAGLKLLEKWYPNGKIIHLTRDPRAIYISKSNDEASRRRKKEHHYLATFYNLFLIFLISFEYRISAIQHKKYNGRDNYILIKYEDLVSNPQSTIKEICDFLELPYTENMLYASGKPSSLTGKIKEGTDISRIYKWKYVIKPWEKLLIDILTRRSRKILGYGGKSDD